MYKFKIRCNFYILLIEIIYHLKSYVTLMVESKPDVTNLQNMKNLLSDYKTYIRDFQIRKERKQNSIYNKEESKSIYICNIEGEIQCSIEFNISNLIYFNYITI